MKSGAQKKVNDMVAAFIREHQIESVGEAHHLLAATTGSDCQLRSAFIQGRPTNSAEEHQLLTTEAGSSCELRDRRFFSTLLTPQHYDVFTQLLDACLLRAPWATTWSLRERALYARDLQFASRDPDWRAMVEIRSLATVKDEEGIAGLKLALQLAYCEIKNLRDEDRDIEVFFAHMEFLEDVDPESPWAVLGTFVGIMRLVGPPTPSTPKELRFAWKHLRRECRSHRLPCGKQTEGRSFPAGVMSLACTSRAMGLDMLEDAGSAEGVWLLDIATASKVRTQAYVEDLVHLLETASDIKQDEIDDLWIDVGSALSMRDLTLAVKTGAQLEDIIPHSRVKPMVRSLQVQHASCDREATVVQLTTDNIPFAFIGGLSDLLARQFTLVVIFRLIYSVLQLYCQEAIVYHLLLQSKFAQSAELALCFGLWIDRITRGTTETLGNTPMPNDLSGTGLLDVTMGLEGGPCHQPERAYSNALTLLCHGLRIGLRILENATPSPWDAALRDWQSLLNLLAKVPSAISGQLPPAFNHYNVKACGKLNKHDLGCQLCSMGAGSDCEARKKLRDGLNNLHASAVAKHNAVRHAAASRFLNPSEIWHRTSTRPKADHRLARSPTRCLALPLGNSTRMRSWSPAIGELRVVE
ncbi:MAG: hypothetical protein KVP17_004549 [Porospora cf. gigantea B]|uniref:uncharacterized protein n=1 Tax=Porospora cf. gigantea B TaxID=2853592 RepID=UPI0035718472|nr:MAG: hypothetical protein KVP17_004549 [Porospora cf. gigantea B]